MKEGSEECREREVEGEEGRELGKQRHRWALLMQNLSKMLP